MAAFLSSDESDILDAVLEYLENSPLDRPVDERVAGQLARMATTFGFDGEIAFREALRDKPVTTLLQALQYLNANA